MSKLIPNSMLEAIPNLYKTEDVKDTICHSSLLALLSCYSM